MLADTRLIELTLLYDATINLLNKINWAINVDFNCGINVMIILNCSLLEKPGTCS